MRTFVIALLFGALCSPPALAQWRGFRGNQGNGMATGSGYPVKWDRESSVLWRTPLDQPGNGSPIESGGRIFLASSSAEGHERSLICFDAATGTQKWSRSVKYGKTMPTHKTNPYAGSTPVTNGKQVVVWHGSAGLHAYSIDGKPLWSKELGEFRHMWGYGTSPILVDAAGEKGEDLVVLHSGPGEKVFVAAFDLSTGNEVWRHTEPVEGNGERNNDNKYMGSWATPVPMNDVLLCSMPTRLLALVPKTGEIRWQSDGTRGERGDLAYSSPLHEDGIVVVSGGFRGPAYALQPKSLAGDITQQARLWRNDSNPQNIGSGLLLDGYLYRVNAGPNTVDCLDVKTGEIQWQDRGSGGAFWSSISFDGTHGYATDQRGKTLVFKPNPKEYIEVAVNDLAEHCNATPALSGGKIYIRTYDSLWCIGQ